MGGTTLSTWTPHSLFTFGGILNTAQSPAEIWQCGVRIAATGQGGALADPDAFLTYAAQPMHDWFNAGGTQMAFPTTARLNWLEIGQIGADGKYSDPTAHVHEYGSGAAGFGSPSVPDFLPVAVSWKTALAIRKHVYATHGRIYLPMYNASSASGSARIDPAFPGPIRQTALNLLNIIDGAPQNAIPVVASGHGGEIHPITGVRVGDVFDVQRRRKDALKEVYIEASFP